jgi:hypothetical protein
MEKSKLGGSEDATTKGVSNYSIPVNRVAEG